MRRMIPSLQSLICFEAAAKHKTYTHAAQELSMTQSAVSRQIQQLEEFLNLPLFHRVRHGVELTVAGEQYLKNIKTHLLGLEHSTLDLMSHQGLGGTLKLGVVPTFATRWLLPRLHRFNEKYPEITIHLETSTKPFLFSEQIFDAAIYAGTPAQVENWPGTTAHFLMQEDVVAVCSPTLIRKFFPDLIQNQSPSTLDLSPAQLSQLPLLQQTTRPAIWKEWFDSLAYNAPYAMEGQRHELFSMLAVAATHHLGVALIPQMLIEKELSRGELMIVSSHKLSGSRCYYFVYAEQPHNPIMLKFIEWLEQETTTRPHTTTNY
ncbi:LysR family transcriptional regulator [Acinetobacter courvalinii]|jgi:LysR family transcriptional regulator, glycine cleavage system transcriptional activator|uniref:LysR family transcriptional regulator n=1 Tax=Acinetobacter courvalinii TaxID=280147 RepID=UPI0021D2F339|nr:LysR family transcriptional regulator [Acinetobacter courvalinii]MCU4640822.1 LysR family transcriptional regulator [Acinetobacter courvalinii]